MTIHEMFATKMHMGRSCMCVHVNDRHVQRVMHPQQLASLPPGPNGAGTFVGVLPVLVAPLRRDLFGLPRLSLEAGTT